MARSSPLTDDVDPAPRVFRLLASSLLASGEPAGKRLAARLRRDAEILEGRTMTAAESNRPHSRMLSRERRVRPVGNRRRDVVVGRAPRKLLSLEDLRWLMIAIERGEYLDAQWGPILQARLAAAGLLGCASGAKQRQIRDIIDEVEAEAELARETTAGGE